MVKTLRHALRDGAFIVLVSLVCAGCLGLRQQSLVGGPKDVDLLLCDDRFLSLQIGPANVPNRHKIVADQSYIQAPSGKRYGIQTVPHYFDIEQKNVYVRDDIFPCDSEGVRLRRWSNGIWTIHLVVVANGESSVIDQQLKFWTFYYNPIIHGPPN